MGAVAGVGVDLFRRGIALNKLRESWRRGRVEDQARRRLAFEPETLDDEDLARVDELAGESEGVSSLVDALPEVQRAAVRWRVLDGRGYREIAKELDCSSASRSAVDASGCETN